MASSDFQYWLISILQPRYLSGASSRSYINTVYE